MSEASETMETIALLRDELRLQMYLAKVETRELFDRLEKKWTELQHKLRPINQASHETASDVGEATRALIHELHEGYRRVAKAVKSLKR